MNEDKFIFGKNINTGTNYGHIGDSYTGIKQRIFTENDLSELLQQISDFKSRYSAKINPEHITIGNPGDKESTIYCKKIFEALSRNGLKVEMMPLATFGYVNKNFSVSNAPDDSILVEVHKSPNV